MKLSFKYPGSLRLDTKVTEEEGEKESFTADILPIRLVFNLCQAKSNHHTSIPEKKSLHNWSNYTNTLSVLKSYIKYYVVSIV